MKYQAKAQRQLEVAARLLDKLNTHLHEAHRLLLQVEPSKEAKQPVKKKRAKRKAK